MLRFNEFITERKFTEEKRTELAAKGLALPDGSFPIETVKDLKNAIKAHGRGKNIAKVEKHIEKRAKELGREDLIPTEW